eukprot:11706101-Ditylum_brightwellii.AAC.1
MAKDKAKDDETVDISAIVKNLHHREEVKCTFKQMKPITRGETGGTVSYIKVQHPISSPAIYPEVISSLNIQPPWDPIYDEDEVMQRLLQRNQIHLSQAYDTPFASGPLRDHVGGYSTSQGAKEILDGDFSTANFDHLPAINYWIKHYLRRSSTTKQVKVSLTLQEFKDLFKNQDE